MSRIFEALRQSEREGAGSVLLHQSTSAPEVSHQPPPVKGFGLDSVTELSIDSRNGHHLVPFRPEQALAAEKFGVLAAKLNTIRLERELKFVLVTSSVAEEGKTLIAANMAVTLAQQTRKKVLLVEGDLRKPAVVPLLGLGNLAGLGEWAVSHDPIVSYLYRLEKLPLWLLPAGKADHPAEILESKELTQVAIQLADWFDWIIIDSPPVMPMADTNLWSRIADGTLLVVRQGVTPRRALQKTLETLDNPKLLGVVINEASDTDRGRYYSKYYKPYHPSAK